jgi:hypothetical protein
MFLLLRNHNSSGHRREKENMAEFISKKREMFLIQMSLDTKREEIQKYVATICVRHSSVPYFLTCGFQAGRKGRHEGRGSQKERNLAGGAQRSPAMLRS